MATKLMIVDDRAVSRQLVRQVAALPQDTVLEFSSADEAVKALGTFKPDCVMVGVSLPPPDAFPAIRRIRKTYPEMRVVAVSSVPDTGLRQAASEAGATGYVSMENLSELYLLAAPERLAFSPIAAPKFRRKRK